MNNLLRKLIEAAIANQQTLELLLKKHANHLSLNMAKQAIQIFKQAVSTGNGEMALAASHVAASIYLYFEKKYEALDCNIAFYHLKFIRASTQEQYREIRVGCQHIISASQEIEAYDLLFRVWTLAAECSFFAYKSEKEHKIADQWLYRAFMDIVAASNAGIQVKQCKNNLMFPTYVSVLDKIATRVTETFWTGLEKPGVPVLLKQLTSTTEKLIPVDFEFPNEIEKTTSAAIILSSLSYKYGKPATGNTRLDIVMRRAEKNGDIWTWMFTSSSLYRGARKSKSIDLSKLAELRRSILTKYEQLRFSFSSRAGRLWATQEFNQVFGDLLKDEFRENLNDSISNSELFEAIEKSKARLLLDQMSVKIHDFPNSELAAQAITKERQVFHFNSENPQDLSQFEMKLISHLSIGPEIERQQRWGMVVPLENLYKSHGAGFYEGGRVSRLSQVQMSLEDGEALIEYFIPHEYTHPAIELWITAISSTKFRVIKVPLLDLPGWGFIGRLTIGGRQPIDVSPLGELVWKLRTNIRQTGVNEEKAIDLLKYFWVKLILPILNVFGYPDEFKRWIIVPHGVLHYIPFQALSDPNGTYLIEEVALTLSPSASVWHQLQGRHKQPVKSFLGFANPKITYRDSRGNSLKPLPKAEDELKGIRKSLKALEFSEKLREQATEKEFRDLVKGKDLVHLSTHGDFPEQNAVDFHRILLTATSKHNGPVTAEELRRMDLNSARLVTLNICNGGLYRFGPGDEPYGLVPALFTAGAENVLGTLWPIEDDIGRRFIIDFYKNLLACGPAEALRQACIQFIQDQALLRHWAAFVLVGPGRPLS